MQRGLLRVHFPSLYHGSRILYKVDSDQSCQSRLSLMLPQVRQSFVRPVAGCLETRCILISTHLRQRGGITYAAIIDLDVNC